MARRIALFTVCIAVWSGSAWSQTPPNFDRPTICRAAIATIMGRDPKTIRTTKTGDDISYQRYTRPSDNTVWTTRCRIEGTRLYWASEPGGRWRDDPRDEVITYEAAKDGALLTIIERYGDGSANEKTFKKEQL